MYANRRRFAVDVSENDEQEQSEHLSGRPTEMLS